MTTTLSPADRADENPASHRQLELRGPATAVSTVVVAGAFGFAVAHTPNPAATTIGLCGAIMLVLALVVCGPRQVASLSLYTCAFFLALPAIRVTSWMTTSDAFLLIGGFLLLPELPNVRLSSSSQRILVLAIVLIVLGGLLGAMTAAGETTISLVNLGRLVVAAGATLVTFALWSPSARELRRFLMLLLVSGLITSVWAIGNPGANLGRPGGLSGHPNHLALVALIAVGPAIAFSVIPGRHRRWQFASCGASVVLVGALVVSGSRAGLLGFAVAISIASILIRDPLPRRRLALGTVLLAAAAVVGFSALTPENAIERSLNPIASASGSNEARRMLFSEMVTEIRQHPLTGVGFSDPLGGHDAYLQLWAAGGVMAFVGGLLVVAVAGSAVAESRRLRTPRSNFDPAFPLLAATISLMGLLAALAFQNALWNRYIWVGVALVVSSLVVAKGNGGYEGARHS